jgi:hypothetical protein
MTIASQLDLFKRRWSRWHRWFWTMLGAAIAIGLIVILANAFQGQRALVSRGETEIDRFHALYQTGDFDEIYGAIHPALKRTLSQDDALQRLLEVRRRLGSVKDMSYACSLWASRHSNRFLRLEYRVEFENEEAWETFDWLLGESDMQLVGYAVETGFEDGQPDWQVAIAPPGVRPNDSTCAAEEEQLAWWERRDAPAL